MESGMTGDVRVNTKGIWRGRTLVKALVDSQLSPEEGNVVRGHGPVTLHQSCVPLDKPVVEPCDQVLGNNCTERQRRSVNMLTSPGLAKWPT